MSFSKRLDEARQAYAKGDKAASAKAHDPKAIHAAREEHGGTGSEYLGSMVYGGLDGIITTFAVVSGVMGAQLDAGIVLILGLANLLGDGFSMATGAFLAAKSDQEYYDREREREAWEVEHFPEGERAELYEIYLEQGYPEEDARKLVEIKTKDPERWVDAMMVDELNMLPENSSPIMDAVVTFGSFLVAGIIPLLYYLADLAFHFGLGSGQAFLVATVLSALALFGLGAAKVFVTENNVVRSGIEMLVVGGLAAGVAYVVGALLKGLGG